MTLAFILLPFVTLVAGWRAWRRLRHFLHIFQLHGYKQREYFNWFRARGSSLIFTPSHGAGLLLLAIGFLLSAFVAGTWWLPILLLAWMLTFASDRRYAGEQEKKRLVFTPRLKRLLVASASIGVLLVIGTSAVAVTQNIDRGVLFFLAGLLLADLLAPGSVTAGASLLKPVENLIQEGFKRRARRKLQSHRNLTVVGITGSYGKTSVKFILDEILKTRFNVLATPASYNTPMGICRVVNQGLKPEHQVLILEMGARYTGDIKELCRLAPPDIAVVTGVGVAHLETMGPIENIARVKGEIIEHMKPAGTAVLNLDDDRVDAMVSRASGAVLGVSLCGREAGISVHDITYGHEGASFVVRDETGTMQQMHTRLVGHHNVLNIALAVAVGRIMGLRLRQMARSVAKLKPVPHRLELRKEGSITVIDDAFNSNPVGARNAVEILGQIRTGRRIIVTPGMIELGDREEDENRSLGEVIASNADFAVLVGHRQTTPIKEGLLKSNFPQNRIKVVATLFEAQDFLKSVLEPGDVVLYENDLPDQYNEPS